MCINMYKQKRNNYSLLFNVLFQFDWHLGEPNKFGCGTTLYCNGYQWDFKMIEVWIQVLLNIHTLLKISQVRDKRNISPTC